MAHRDYVYPTHVTCAVAKTLCTECVADYTPKANARAGHIMVAAITSKEPTKTSHHGIVMYEKSTNSAHDVTAGYYHTATGTPTSYTFKHEALVEPILFCGVMLDGLNEDLRDRPMATVQMRGVTNVLLSRKGKSALTAMAEDEQYGPGAYGVYLGIVCESDDAAAGGTTTNNIRFVATPLGDESQYIPNAPVPRKKCVKYEKAVGFVHSYEPRSGYVQIEILPRSFAKTATGTKTTPASGAFGFGAGFVDAPVEAEEIPIHRAADKEIANAASGLVQYTEASTSKSNLAVPVGCTLATVDSYKNLPIAPLGATVYDSPDGPVLSLAPGQAASTLLNGTTGKRKRGSTAAGDYSRGNMYKLVHHNNHQIPLAKVRSNDCVQVFPPKTPAEGIKRFKRTLEDNLLSGKVTSPEEYSQLLAN